MKNSSFLTSMFVERMEVLEYCQKFIVELSTFPDSDSTNTETPRKLLFFFSLTCACLSFCLCEKVCQWISCKRVDRFGWKFWCMLQLASNQKQKPPITSTIGPILPPKSEREMIFAILWTLISRKPFKRSKKKRRPYRRKLWRSTHLILYIFSISLTVFIIFWKKKPNYFWKKLVRG